MSHKHGCKYEMAEEHQRPDQRCECECGAVMMDGTNPDDSWSATMSNRVKLQQRDDGGWYADCGCRFDYWDGKPTDLNAVATVGGLIRTYCGKVAPHWHLCQHHAEPSYSQFVVDALARERDDSNAAATAARADEARLRGHLQDERGRRAETVAMCEQLRAENEALRALQPLVERLITKVDAGEYDHVWGTYGIFEELRRALAGAPVRALEPLDVEAVQRFLDAPEEDWHVDNWTRPRLARAIVERFGRQARHARETVVPTEAT